MGTIQISDPRSDLSVTWVSSNGVAQDVMQNIAGMRRFWRGVGKVHDALLGEPDAAAPEPLIAVAFVAGFFFISLCLGEK